MPKEWEEKTQKWLEGAAERAEKKDGVPLLTERDLFKAQAALLNMAQTVDIAHQQVRNREKAVETLTAQLALEVGRNELWQKMFEDLAVSAAAMSSFIKKTYMTKLVDIQEMQGMFLVADSTEQMVMAYRRRKDKVDSGAVSGDRILD